MIEQTSAQTPPIAATASLLVDEACSVGEASAKCNGSAASFHLTLCKSPIGGGTGTLEDIQQAQDFVNRLIAQCEYMEAQIETLNTKLKDQQFFIDEVQSKNINLQNERLNLKDELAVAKSKNADYLELIEEYETRLQPQTANKEPVLDDRNEECNGCETLPCLAIDAFKEEAQSLHFAEGSEDAQALLKSQEQHFNEQLKDFSLKLTELLHENKQLHQLLAHRDFSPAVEAPENDASATKSSSARGTPRSSPQSPAFSAAFIANGDFVGCIQMLLDRLASADARQLHRRLGKAFDVAYICRFATTVIRSVESELRIVQNAPTMLCKSATIGSSSSSDTEDQLRGLLMRSLREICALRRTLVELGPKYILQPLTQPPLSQPSAAAKSAASRSGTRVGLIEYLFGGGSGSGSGRETS